MVLALCVSTHIKFHEDILNCFQLMQLHTNITGINSKIILRSLHSACHLPMLSMHMKFQENILKGFQIADFVTDRQTNMSKTKSLYSERKAI